MVQVVQDYFPVVSSLVIIALGGLRILHLLLTLALRQLSLVGLFYPFLNHIVGQVLRVVRLLVRAGAFALATHDFLAGLQLFLVCGDPLLASLDSGYGFTTTFLCKSSDLLRRDRARLRRLHVVRDSRDHAHISW